MINYGHRGACAYAPENTMTSFHLALRIGANGLETDVRRTKDGHLVLYHDGTLRRITGAEGGVADYTLDELYAMDFGAYMGQAFRGEPIALLEDFLYYFSKKPIELAIEVKAEGIAGEVIAQIHRFNSGGRVILTAFELENLVQARRADPDIRLGWLVSAVTEDTYHQLRANKIGQLCPHAEAIDGALMERAKREGLTVRAWGVKNPRIMEDLLAHKDLYGMTVNFPDKLAALMDCPEGGENAT